MYVEVAGFAPSSEHGNVRWLYWYCKQKIILEVRFSTEPYKIAGRVVIPTSSIKNVAAQSSIGNMTSGKSTDSGPPDLVCRLNVLMKMTRWLWLMKIKHTGWTVPQKI